MSLGVLRPGLDQPPGRGEGDLEDMSKLAGVPGMEGSTSPRCPPELPDVVPNLLRESEVSWRFRFGGCFAAELRLRRWPAEAEKEVGEARANDFNGEEAEAARNGLDVACKESHLLRQQGKSQAQGINLTAQRRAESKASSKGRVKARSREAVLPKTGRRFEGGCTASMCQGYR